MIRPALAKGMTVVCGRFSDSTFAYQGFGAGVPLDTLRALDAAATDGLHPDLTILLDVPVEVGLAGEEPHRFRVVDATRPVEEVAGEVWTLVEGLPTRADSEPEAPRARISR